MKKPEKPKKPKRLYPESEMPVIQEDYLLTGSGWRSAREVDILWEAHRQSDDYADVDDLYSVHSMSKNDLDNLLDKVGIRDNFVIRSYVNDNGYPELCVTFNVRRPKNDLDEVRAKNQALQIQYEKELLAYERAKEDYKIHKAQYDVWKAEQKLDDLRKGFSDGDQE